MITYRAKINQPAIYNELHALHGKLCIVQDVGGENVTLYFTEGEVHSLICPRRCIYRIYTSDAQTK